MAIEINLTPENNKNADGERKPDVRAPSGQYMARIARIVHIGIQPGYQGWPARQKLRFYFEISKVKDHDGKNLLLFEDISLAGGKKATLTKLAAAVGLTGHIDVEQLLGKALQIKVELTTSKKGNEYNNIPSFNEIMEEFKSAVPELENSSYVFDFNNPDPELFSKLSGLDRWIMENKAVNYSGSKVEALINEYKASKGDVVKPKAAGSIGLRNVAEDHSPGTADDVSGQQGIVNICEPTDEGDVI